MTTANKQIIIILFILASTQVFFSQTKKSVPETIKELKKLGRDSLIKLAISKVDEPGFDASAYDRVVVKLEKDALLVDFSLSVLVSDKKSCFYSSVTVALVGQGTGRSIQGFCDEPAFYKHTNSTKKKIAFVFDSINKSDEIGHVPNHILPPGTTMSIEERLTFYHVETTSWSTHSYFDVDKLTGKISDAHHKHYARSHDEKPDFEIIK